MKNNTLLPVSFFLIFLNVSCSTSQEKMQDMTSRVDVQRTVSITIDDLPVVGAENLEERQQITEYAIPAVGFVNEGKLGDPEPLPEEIALLEAWLDAGMELANHTHSHFWFNSTPLEEFKADVLRGEIVTTRLLNEHGMPMRYFRHPFLDTGDDPEKTSGFNTFLAENSYIVAPVTIDNSDWFYNRAYARALRTEDKELAERIADDYVRYMQEVFNHVEQFTLDVLNREPAQILLIHANRLNADHFDRVAELILGMGYEFITLEEALQDPMYRLPEVHNDPSTMRGLSRIWSGSGADEPPQRPSIPEWIARIAEG